MLCAYVPLAYVYHTICSICYTWYQINKGWLADKMVHTYPEYKWRRRFGVVGGVCALMVAAAYGTPASGVISVSQSYGTEADLAIGSLVSLKKNSADEVVPSISTNAESLLGVVISADSSLLALTNGKGKQVQVATSGTVPVIVSDANGTIMQNDHITASPISGVGMKATTNVRIIGIAQGDMVKSNTGKQDYTAQDGSKHTVQLGQVPVLVNVSYFFKEPDKTVVPAAVQNIANSLAGRQVSTVPILVSAAIFVIMIIVVLAIIYSMIKSSIISVGRNPMSQSAIYRDLVQLSALVLVILTVGLTSIYLILTKL